MPTTTIQIDIEVREQLRAHGRMGESYNDVIRRLLLAARAPDRVRLEARGGTPALASKPWVPLRDRD
jgi:predicted CopG family antitoxin